MTNPIIRIHDLSTNEIVDRPMSDEEYEDFTNPKPAILPITQNEAAPK